MAGGGIGEAMLIGAALGGGTSALSGQDPLKGAVLGAATGGIGGGGALAADQLGMKLVENELLNKALIGAGTGGISSLLTGQDPMRGALLGGAATAGAGLFGGAPTGTMPGATPAAAGADAASKAFSAQTSTGLAALPGDQGAISGGLLSRFSNLPLEKQLLYGGGAGLGLMALTGGMGQKGVRDMREPYTGPLSKFSYDPSTFVPTTVTPDVYTPRYMADGGIASLNAPDMVIGGNPLDSSDTSQFDWQQRSNPVLKMADGGISSLGSYSDGGRLLKGPGDGMSDHIPATIADKRPARLADGEFVVPADVVSHLGNGSTDAGAKQLYSMMDRVRKARTGNDKQGKQIKPHKFMPA